MAATNKRGVFSLETALERQSDNNWVKIPEVFRYVNSLEIPANPGGPAYGYWAGGSGSQTVTRLDFGNDTAAQAPKGPLAQTAYSYGGTASSTNAYFYGGQMAGSRIQRINFATDTNTALLRGPLSAAAGYQGTVGNDSFGYSVAGGGSVPTTSNVDRLDYANDTSTASPKGKASEARQGVMGGAGNNNYGYIGGGVVHPGSHFKTTMDRIDYANDTATMTVKGPLSGSGKYYMGAAGNSSYGYFGTGYGPSDSRVDRLDYSSDTTQASLKGPLSSGKGFYGATGNSSYGYYGGGGPGGPGSTVDRIDYSNDTASYVAMSNLPSSLMKLTAASAQDNGQQTAAVAMVPATRTEVYPNPAAGPAFGYMANSTAFQPSGPDTDIDRIDYSNDTATALVKGLTNNARYSSAGTSNLTHGYVAGGYSPSLNSRTSFVDRIDFGNDTATAVVKGVISNGRNSLLGAGNSSYGWIGGGSGEPGGVAGGTRVDRIDYSNDTATASPRGPLSQFRANGGAVSTQSYGYYGAGNSVDPPGYPTRTSVDRIDYSNDTPTAVLKGNLTVARYRTKASGNKTHGYWAGGDADPYNPSIFSTVDRIDFSNDTAAAVEKGPLSSSISNMGATTSGASGYYAGTTTPAGRSVVQRTDYSNDTATASPKGNLSRDRISSAGISAAENASPVPITKVVDKGSTGYITGTTPAPAGVSYGYFTGGVSPAGESSQTQRIEFANDTATSTPKGPLTENTRMHSGTGSTSYGYLAGRLPNKTNADRIDYSNDTATATSKASVLVDEANRRGAVGNNSYGYWAGGTPNTTKISRLDYSNDSGGGVQKGNIHSPRMGLSGTGNQNYGYIAGGFSPANVDRIDYANDTSNTLTRGPLNASRYGVAAFGNASYGYWGGGYPESSSSVGSTIARLDYANDTNACVLKGNLTETKYWVTGLGTPNYGYVGGGREQHDSSQPDFSDTTKLERIDFSNDTATASPKGPLAVAVRETGAVSGAQNANPNPGPISVYTPRIRWVDSVSTISATGHGYTSGGQKTPGTHLNMISTTERIDYANDTATAVTKGSLQAVAGYNAGSTGNRSFGYVAGGSSGSPAENNARTTIDRLDYANDTTNTSKRGDLSTAIMRGAGVGNISFGYFMGRHPGGISSSSRVQRLDYAADTTATVDKGPLSSVRYLQKAAGNQNSGYSFGGMDVSPGPGAMSSVDRILYSSDTPITVIKGPLSMPRWDTAASSNANFAYVGGGAGPASIVDRIEFSNDTATATPKGNLTFPRRSQGAHGNTNFGYYVGGDGPGIRSDVTRIDYSNDTATPAPKGPLGAAKKYTTGYSFRSNAISQPVAGPARIAAPTLRPFSVPAPLSPPVPNPYGYVVGGSGNGDPSGNTNNNPAQRIDFTNDTATASVKAAPANPPGDRHYYSSATSNRDFAYSCMAGTRSYIQRLDYSNDSANFLIKGHRYTGFSNAPSNYGGYHEAATGNLSYGYWNGGYKNYSSPVDPSVCPNGHIQAYSHIDRIDYSNDTANSLRRSYTTTKRGGGAAAGTNEHGYWIGNGANQCSGSYAGTIVERTDYASDTTNASVRGNLNTSTDGGRAAGNKDYAWLSGRQWHQTNVERIDYANDTATASIKGNLSSGRTYHSATGNQDYGYACGTHDFSLSYKSIVERIDYSNDTATGSPKGPLAYATASGGGTSATLNNNGGTVPG